METASPCHAELPEDTCRGIFPLKTEHGLCHRCRVLDALNDQAEYRGVAALPQCMMCSNIIWDGHATQTVCADCVLILDGVDVNGHSAEQAGTAELQAQRVVSAFHRNRPDAWMVRMFAKATQKRGAL
ncbi:hypothetical protein BDZ89DRAFT_1168623 [Hymenopellis radicata]|nr:hypothetical protein BDZ89DRAFT_1168623 [Hymenopellis radicata]